MKFKRLKKGLPGVPGTLEDAMDRWSDRILSYQLEEPEDWRYEEVEIDIDHFFNNLA